MKGNLAAMFSGLAAAAALLSPVVVNASSVMYDFTGTVTYSDGIYGAAAAGTTVSGSYTINFGAYDPSASNTPVRNNGNWSYANQGGSTYSAPLQSALVFSSTLSGIDGVNYHSTISGTLADTSEISGGPGAFIPYTLHMGELALPASGKYGTGSDLTLQGTSLVWNAQGLPNLAAANIAAAGEIATYQSGTPFTLLMDQLDYKVTSIKRVTTSAPELEPASLAGGITLLFGLVAVMRSRRSVRAIRQ